MDKAYKEKVVSAVLKPADNHKYLKPLLVICVGVILFMCFVFGYLASNRKRFSSLAIILMLFTVGSSFSFPVFSEGMSEVTQDGKNGEGAVREGTEDYDYELKLASESDIRPEDVEILDDDDVLEGYEDAELHGMENADGYTLDDILEGNMG